MHRWRGEVWRPLPSRWATASRFAQHLACACCQWCNVRWLATPCLTESPTARWRACTGSFTPAMAQLASRCVVVRRRWRLTAQDLALTRIQRSRQVRASGLVHRLLRYAAASSPESLACSQSVKLAHACITSLVHNLPAAIDDQPEAVTAFAGTAVRNLDATLLPCVPSPHPHTTSTAVTA